MNLYKMNTISDFCVIVASLIFTMAKK